MRAILAIAIVAVSVLAVTDGVYAYLCGNMTDYSGASGQTCTSCHGRSSGPGSVVIETPTPGTFAPGSLIPITVRIDNPQKATGNGFQLVAKDQASLQAAFMVPIDGTTWVNPRAFLAHTMSGTQRSSWTVYCETTVGQSPFTLFAAAVDGNNDETYNGDFVHTTSIAMTPGTVPLSLAGLPTIGSTVRLNLDSPRDAERSYVMVASLTKGGFVIGNRVIPVSPDALFMLTTNNLLPGIFGGYQGTLNHDGRAEAVLRIPEIEELRGITLHHAFVVLDLNETTGIGTISNPLPVTLF